MSEREEFTLLCLDSDGDIEGEDGIGEFSFRKLFDDKLLERSRLSLN
jgi:hypothetical protein